MNTFDVKYYEDIALAYWVERKPVPTEDFRFDRLLKTHLDEVIEERHYVIDFHRDMRCAMFEWGWVILTTHLDSEQTTTCETLISYNGKTATLVHRYRYGPNFNRLQPYDRDDILPIPSTVSLIPCSTQSSCHIPTSEEV